MPHVTLRGQHKKKVTQDVRVRAPFLPNGFCVSRLVQGVKQVQFLAGAEDGVSEEVTMTLEDIGEDVRASLGIDSRRLPRTAQGSLTLRAHSAIRMVSIPQLTGSGTAASPRHTR